MNKIKLILNNTVFLKKGLILVCVAAMIYICGCAKPQEAEISSNVEKSNSKITASDEVKIAESPKAEASASSKVENNSGAEATTSSKTSSEIHIDGDLLEIAADDKSDSKDIDSVSSLPESGGLSEDEYYSKYR